MDKSKSKEIMLKAFQASKDNYVKLLETETYYEQVQTALDIILESYKKGGGLFVCGNGGSAADAQHFVAELVVKLSQDRTPIKAFALTVDSSILTAIGNDFSYDHIFSRQVYANMNKNDVLFAITTSGNSPNVLEALKACKEVGAKSILLTGHQGGKGKAAADHSIVAPGEQTAQIQEAHLVIYHTLCYLIEVGLVDAGLVKYKPKA